MFPICLRVPASGQVIDTWVPAGTSDPTIETHDEGDCSLHFFAPDGVRQIVERHFCVLTEGAVLSEHLDSDSVIATWPVPDSTSVLYELMPPVADDEA